MTAIKAMLHVDFYSQQATQCLHWSARATKRGGTINYTSLKASPQPSSSNRAAQKRFWLRVLGLRANKLLNSSRGGNFKSTKMIWTKTMLPKPIIKVDTSRFTLKHSQAIANHFQSLTKHALQLSLKNCTLKFWFRMQKKICPPIITQPAVAPDPPSQSSVLPVHATRIP